MPVEMQIIISYLSICEAKQVYCWWQFVAKKQSPPSPFMHHVFLSFSVSPPQVLCPISHLCPSPFTFCQKQEADNSSNEDELKYAVAGFGFPRHTMEGPSAAIITQDSSSLLGKLIFLVFFLFVDLPLCRFPPEFLSLSGWCFYLPPLPFVESLPSFSLSLSHHVLLSTVHYCCLLK